MLRLTLALAIVVAFLAGTSPAAQEAGAVQPINFIRGALTGSGFGTTNPSSVAFGPDGRLYVADTNGRIQALTLDPATKAVTAVQQVTTNGDLQEVFGIAFDPADSASPPPIYVSNTISGFGDASPAAPGTFPGKITKISGAGYATREDVITGLPVSNSGHETNGIAFGPDGKLYIAQGSTTNAGVINPDPEGLFQRAESPLSGAMLVADIHEQGFDGTIEYSPLNTYSDTVDQTRGDVSVYAPGFRNPYDLVWHSNGRLYATDNGPNAGYGPGSQDCSTAFPGDAAALDALELVVAGDYYGHPNRNRGRTDARQCTYHANTEPSSPPDYNAPIEPNLPASSNGIAEYRSGVFGGQMQGDLLYAAWVDSQLHRVKLSPDGSAVVSDTTLATGLTLALDVAVGGDGTIYVAEYGGSKVTFFKPDTSAVSSITVTGILPLGGPIGGGQHVTITGTNFTTSADTTVTLGGLPLTNVVVQNSGTLTATTPANSTGTKSLTVTNSIGTATLPSAYNYSAGGGTVPPVARAGEDIITPIAHENHAHVTLDARASTDADGFIASYLWSENGTPLSANVLDSVQMTLGTHVVTLTVTDNDGFVATDDVRISVIATPVNPDPYYCFDVNGDGPVNATDVNLVVQAYGTRYGDAGYSRLRDWNSDRVINSADVKGTQDDFTAACPHVDQQIRTATAAMQQFQNIANAYAANYRQITQFIPGMGRHLLRISPAADTIFDPADPEALLYEPDPAAPQGWRLSGAMFYIPIAQAPLPPDGFDTNDDPWHYHTSLCFFSNGTVAELPQAQCVAGGGLWQDKSGWLLHLWNYRLNPKGRFIEIDDDSGVYLPKASIAAVSIDANPLASGIQPSRGFMGSNVTVDVTVSGVAEVGAFNFDVVYDPAVFGAVAVNSGPSTDRNPDADQAFLESSGRAFACTPPDPATALTAGTKRAARIVCTSSGTVPAAGAMAPRRLASLTLSVVGSAPAGSALSLQNVNVFSTNGDRELASCAPTVSVTAACYGAMLSTQSGPDADADGVADTADNCPGVSNPDQQNSDAAARAASTYAIMDATAPAGDTLGDACDPDDDNDGLPDAGEYAAGGCPGFDLSLTAHPAAAAGDITDDDDGDGVPAPADAADNGPSWDTDNDGVLDGVECQLGTDPRDRGTKPPATACGETADADGDGLPASGERCKWGTSDTAVSGADSDGDGTKDCVEANDTDGNGVANFTGDVINSAKAALGIIGKTMDFDLDGNGNVSFTGDTILSAKMVNHVGGICP